MSKFTPKQEAFVHWYCSAVVNMNGTEAARRAGYAGSDNTLANVASENLRKPYLRAAIDKRLEKALSGADVTVEAVLRELDALGAKASEAGQYGAAIRASELKGKYLKMFTDRIEHVQSIEDMGTDELVRLFHEIREAGNVDLLRLLEGDGPELGDGADRPRGTPTH
jgi:hypothetical protein